MLRFKLLVAVILLVYITKIKAQESRALCLKDDSAVEPGRNCRKACTSNSDCKGLKTCNCDDVCGLSCFNPQAECPSPPDLEHGSITYTYGLIYKSTLRYRCDKSYVLVGEMTRKCRSDRFWTGDDNARCVKGCDIPKGIANGYVATRKAAFLVGEEVDYKCHHGYEMQGVGNIVECQSNYDWTKPSIRCEKRDCGNPPNIINGEIDLSEGTKFAATIKYTCDTGYELKGIRTRYCPTSGSWSDRAPTCEPVKCPDPPITITNGRQVDFFSEYSYRDIVRYECTGGYVMKGNNQITCDANKEWGSIPECIVDLLCTFDEVRRPQCGYTTHGSINWIRKAVPGSSGLTTYAMTVALPFQSSAILRSDIIDSSETHCLQMEYYIVQRRSGTVMKIQSSTQGTVYGIIHRDEPRSRWLKKQFELTSDNKKNIQFDFHVSNAGVSIYLDNVRVLSGNCESNCPPGSCSGNGHCADRLTSRDCYCVPGYKGGNCQTEITCPTTTHINNGFVIPVGAFKYGVEVIYHCNRGYRLRGENSATCSDTGYWSNRVPSCEVLQCTRRTWLANGQITTDSQNSRKVGAVITYTCNEGYALRGSKTSFCKDDESWSTDLPTCERKECQRPIEPTFGSVTGGPFYVGSNAQFTCRSGYKLSSTEPVTCSNDGEWIGVTPQCIKDFEPPKPRTCNSPVQTNNNENRPIQLSTEKALYDLYDVVEFSCPSGRYLQGHSSIECLRNGDWSAAVPQCLSTLNGSYCTEYQPYKVKQINDMCYYWATWKHKGYTESKAKCLGNSHFPTLRSTEAIQRIGKIIYNAFPKKRFNLKFFTGLNSIDQANYRWQTGEIYEEVPNVNFQLNTWSPRWHVQIVQLSRGSTRETPVVNFASQYWPGASNKISVMCEFLPNDYKDLVLVSKTYAEYSGVFVKENGVYNTNKTVYKHKTKADTYLFYTGLYWCVGKFSYREANSCLYSLENEDILQIPWLTLSTRSQTDIYIKEQSASVSRWHTWGNWEECSGGYQTRSRTCQDFGMEGKLGCQGNDKDTRECDEWGPFTRCSKTCGNSEKTSNCISGPCIQKIRIESCNMSPCPEWSDWSACDRTCGGGVRSRTCSIEDACSGPKRELCNTVQCESQSSTKLKRPVTTPVPTATRSTDPPDVWSECSASCGEGIQTCISGRCEKGERNCTHPNVCTCQLDKSDTVDAFLYGFKQTATTFTEGQEISFKCREQGHHLTGDSFAICSKGKFEYKIGKPFCT